MKKIFLIILISVIFFPVQVGVVGAESDFDKEERVRLLKQIEFLMQEVLKLQEMLLEKEEGKYKPLEDYEMREVISLGVDWFKEAQGESGHFAYEYAPYEDKYLPLDNIVRQAGGLYALGEVALHDKENKYKLKETLERGVGYFESLSKRSEWNGHSFKCISNSSVNDMCQLGATSLALIGIVDLVTRYPELVEKYDPLINEYATYILAMKKDEEGFRHGYISGATPNETESSFSNGEAMLALVRYYKYSEDVETKRVLDEVFNYFNSEAVGFDFPLYLWAMAAIKDMNELWPNEEYVKYVEGYTDWRINGFAYRKGSGHNMCAYVEGVLSAYSVLEGNIEIKKLESISREIHYWLQQSKKLQITENDRYRIISTESGSYFGEILNMSNAKGGFLTDQNELTQRIDFTQHCINSYLQQFVDLDKGEL